MQQCLAEGSSWVKKFLMLLVGPKSHRYCCMVYLYVVLVYVCLCVCVRAVHI